MRLSPVSLIRGRRIKSAIVALLGLLTAESSAWAFAEFSMPNVLQLSENIISGSQPSTEQAFREIANAGIETIVSVDGNQPNLALAKKHGLRYVHIPIGYDGIPTQARLALTRVVRESSAPIYIHCHHGKHRGPAAAAIACLVESTADKKRALEILQQAGTSRDYPGLWRDVEDFKVPGADAELPKLVEAARPKPLARQMSAIGRDFKRLNQADAAGWNLPSMAQHALLLRQAFRESIRTASKKRTKDFMELMKVSESTSLKLYKAIKTDDVKSTALYYASLRNTCAKCHEAYRN